MMLIITYQTRRKRGNVAPTREAKPDHWVIPALILGTLIGLLYSLDRTWFSEKIWAVVLLTAGLFWSTVASFKLQWRNEKFWYAIAFLFVLHLGLMLILSPWLAFQRLTIFAIGLPEVLGMWIALAWQFGYKTPSKDSDSR